MTNAVWCKIRSRKDFMWVQQLEQAKNLKSNKRPHPLQSKSMQEHWWLSKLFLKLYMHVHQLFSSQISRQEWVLNLTPGKRIHVFWWLLVLLFVYSFYSFTFQSPQITVYVLIFTLSILSLYLACGISGQFVVLLFFSMKNILFKIPTLTHLTILCDHSGSEYQEWVPVAEATLWS